MERCESCGSWQEDCDCLCPPWRTKEYEHGCDGCGQLESECLCEVDPADAADCQSIYHPGCSRCEVRGEG